MEQNLKPTFFTQICQARDTLAMIAALSAVFYQQPWQTPRFGRYRSPWGSICMGFTICIYITDYISIHPSVFCILIRSLPLVDTASWQIQRSLGLDVPGDPLSISRRPDDNMAFDTICIECNMYNTIYIPYNIYNTKYIYNTIYTLQYIYNTISIWPLTQYMKRRKHDKDYKMLSHIKCAVFLKVFQKCHNFNKRTFFKFNVAVTE